MASGATTARKAGGKFAVQWPTKLVAPLDAARTAQRTVPTILLPIQFCRGLRINIRQGVVKAFTELVAFVFVDDFEDLRNGGFGPRTETAKGYCRNCPHFIIGI